MDKEHKTPECIGIIIDGNRRYARERDLPTIKGHHAGYKKLRDFVLWARDAGVKCVIAYSFSTENWGRKEEEVGYLMELLRTVLSKELKSLKEEGIHLHIVGEKDRFDQDIQKLMNTAEKETEGMSNIDLALALSYGGRAELISAANKLVDSGETVDEEKLSNVLWTAGLPDPDMIIRTGGELRLSNFLPWQSSYSELFFTDTLWPAFTKKEFHKMLEEFGERDRRRGK